MLIPTSRYKIETLEVGDKIEFPISYFDEYTSRPANLINNAIANYRNWYAPWVRMKVRTIKDENGRPYKVTVERVR